MAIKVTNLNGTANNKCKCESWIVHWETFSKRAAAYCSVSACMEKSGLVGAHVQKAPDSNWYIIPQCTKHNSMLGRELMVEDYTDFISANVQETCGKS